MPLTRKVSFRGTFQIGQRVRIPNVIRHEYKLEPCQVLKVSFSFPQHFKGWQSFYAKMEKAGRIFIPKETLAIWQDEKANLQGSIVDVTLEPA